MTTTLTAIIGSRTYTIETDTSSDTVHLFTAGGKGTNGWEGSADWNGTSLHCFRGHARRLARGIARALSAAGFRGPLARTLAA